MAQYPRQQAHVVSLVDTMITGITEHPGDFPHCDSALLEADRSDFLNAGNILVAANAQVGFIVLSFILQSSSLFYILLSCQNIPLSPTVCILSCMSPMVFHG